MNYSKCFALIPCILFAIVGLVACDNGGAGGAEKSSLPKARGAFGEIILVIDSTKFAGPVGEILTEIFEEDIKGIIREESLFNLKSVDPRSLTRILKMATNMVYVTTFDDPKPGSRVINNQFTEESKVMAKEDPNLFMLREKDEFAIGQDVIYLFGNNEEQLIQNLRQNKSKLQNLFLSKERERLGKALFNRKNSLATVLGRDKFGVELSLPASYQLAKEEDQFLWFRQPTPRTDKPDISLLFYMTDYTDESEVFPENIIALRNSILKPRVFADPSNKDSFLVTETLEPPVFSNTTIDGQYAVEMRGAWKSNNLSMGGSFLSYTVVDAERGKIFYIEGFVYYPSEAHRAPLREIETILVATGMKAAESN
ncbi:hypothetical protein ADIS_0940 [Lunatimonas lonarensis]|uniref:DUF4837 domain-containing protein n=1 Tax=Lunatimonas lonarensis TaxID=1232681 RepID=R7ZWS6_9BACT|nr:DUF4837 family protein [Lunatimonas lonarensis]EON78590.1 hypothetical protein ADIS_0940 [Lunatimonas lonarensis]